VSGECCAGFDRTTFPKKTVNSRVINMKLILGILLPPLGVFLAYGFSVTLLINIGLTLLGWVPGIIHAVWAISKQGEQTNN
jgi:uncharacterized membrane protein YqaE (UPF0057 family)